MYTVPRSYGRIDAPESREQSRDAGPLKSAASAQIVFEFRLVTMEGEGAGRRGNAQRREPQSGGRDPSDTLRLFRQSGGLWLVRSQSVAALWLVGAFFCPLTVMATTPLSCFTTPECVTIAVQLGGGDQPCISRYGTCVPPPTTSGQCAQRDPRRRSRFDSAVAVADLAVQRKVPQT